jgi:release factor glutamine methyltransferase
VLARTALGWERATWLARRDDPAPADALTTLDGWIDRRERREPVAYITGHREFWGLDFVVTSAVLIPRPETELVVEAALQRLADRDRAWRIADVGTGSGCLAVALACERPDARVIASDIPGEALEVARRNAARHGVADRIEFIQGDLLDPITRICDLIVANPPYVVERARPALGPEVRDHEPGVALFGGNVSVLPDVDSACGLLAGQESPCPRHVRAVDREAPDDVDLR